MISEPKQNFVLKEVISPNLVFTAKSTSFNQNSVTHCETPFSNISSSHSTTSNSQQNRLAVSSRQIIIKSDVELSSVTFDGSLGVAELNRNINKTEFRGDSSCADDAMQTEFPSAKEKNVHHDDIQIISAESKHDTEQKPSADLMEKCGTKNISENETLKTETLLEVPKTIGEEKKINTTENKVKEPLLLQSLRIKRPGEEILNARNILRKPASRKKNIPVESPKLDVSNIQETTLKKVWKRPLPPPQDPAAATVNELKQLKNVLRRPLKTLPPAPVKKTVEDKQPTDDNDSQNTGTTKAKKLWKKPGIPRNNSKEGQHTANSDSEDDDAAVNKRPIRKSKKTTSIKSLNSNSVSVAQTTSQTKEISLSPKTLNNNPNTVSQTEKGKVISSTPVASSNQRKTLGLQTVTPLINSSSHCISSSANTLVKAQQSSLGKDSSSVAAPTAIIESSRTDNLIGLCASKSADSAYGSCPSTPLPNSASQLAVSTCTSPKKCSHETQAVSPISLKSATNGVKLPDEPAKKSGKTCTAQEDKNTSDEICSCKYSNIILFIYYFFALVIATMITIEAKT